MTVDELMDAAQRCKDMSTSLYENTLAEIFGNEIDTRYAYDRLADLPFTGYITTNFDPLLFNAVDRRVHLKNGTHVIPAVYPGLDPRYFERTPNPVAYIHGMAKDENAAPSGRNLVLARSDFDEAYETLGFAREFLSMHLRHHDVLFLGCELKEEPIMSILKKMRLIEDHFESNNAGYKRPTRVMLTAEHQRKNTKGKFIRDKDSEREQNKALKSLGITILRYRLDKKHSEIERILGTAVEELSEPRSIIRHNEITS